MTVEWEDNGFKRIGTIQGYVSDETFGPRAIIWINNSLEAIPFKKLRGLQIIVEDDKKPVETFS